MIVSSGLFKWLHTSMYDYEYFLENDIFHPPYPERHIPEPHPVELYNIKEDPLEQNNLATKYPDKTRKLLTDLENWFEEVEKERLTIND